MDILQSHNNKKRQKAVGQAKNWQHQIIKYFSEVQRMVGKYAADRKYTA